MVHFPSFLFFFHLGFFSLCSPKRVLEISRDAHNVRTVTLYNSMILFTLSINS